MLYIKCLCDNIFPEVIGLHQVKMWDDLTSK